MLICRKGALSQGQQSGVDKEFVALFTVLDENESWLLSKNIQRCPGENLAKIFEDLQRSS